MTSLPLKVARNQESFGPRPLEMTQMASGSKGSRRLLNLVLRRRSSERRSTRTPHHFLTVGVIMLHISIAIAAIAIIGGGH